MTKSPARVPAISVALSSWWGEMECLFIRLNTCNDLFGILKLGSDFKAVNHAKMFL
jgi:hypothetical protein